MPSSNSRGCPVQALLGRGFQSASVTDAAGNIKFWHSLIVLQNPSQAELERGTLELTGERFFQFSVQFDFNP